MVNFNYENFNHLYNMLNVIKFNLFINYCSQKQRITLNLPITCQYSQSFQSRREYILIFSYVLDIQFGFGSSHIYTILYSFLYNRNLQIYYLLAHGKDIESKPINCRNQADKSFSKKKKLTNHKGNFHFLLVTFFSFCMKNVIMI